ncbi:Arginine/agmatine antiporter [Raoultella ornithinolytica]|nr:Arginine/agmatine antiporter [Raoultella ornithinolytica]
MSKCCARTNQMGLLALTVMTASNMMGSGVFMLPATLARIGAISVWGWGVAFLAITALALIFCKMSELFPRNGGIIASITASFGPFVGLQMTLFYWLSTWIGNCALLLAGVGYLSYFFPALHNPLYGTSACIILLWLSVLWGLRGAKLVGYAQLFTGGCMVVVILSIGMLGWWHFDAGRYQMSWNVSNHSDLQAIINAATISLWGFLGIESASVSFGQVKNPRRTVPLATLLGLAIAGLCYATSTNVMMGILPHDVLVNSSSPFARQRCRDVGESRRLSDFRYGGYRLSWRNAWLANSPDRSPQSRRRGWTFTGFFCPNKPSWCSVGRARFHCIFDDPAPAANAVTRFTKPVQNHYYPGHLRQPSTLRFRCHFTPGNDGHQSPEETYKLLLLLLPQLRCALFHHISPYDRKFGNGGVGNRFTAGHSPSLSFLHCQASSSKK